MSDQVKDLHDAEAETFKQVRGIKKGGDAARKAVSVITSKWSALGVAAIATGTTSAHASAMSKVQELASAGTDDAIRAAYINLVTEIPAIHEKAAELAPWLVKGENTNNTPPVTRVLAQLAGLA